MKKAVILSIRGKQEYDNVPPERMELLTRGTLSWNQEGYTVTYQESEVTGLDGTQTTIQVESGGQRVTLLRTGGYNSQMVFEEGRRHMSLYNTPFGSMTVGVNTRHLLAELDENGGVVEIDYSIEIEHTVAGRNVFQISVREDTGGGLKQ